MSTFAVILEFYSKNSRVLLRVGCLKMGPLWGFQGSMNDRGSQIGEPLIGAPAGQKGEERMLAEAIARS